VVKVEM